MKFPSSTLILLAASILVGSNGAMGQSGSFNLVDILNDMNGVVYNGINDDDLTGSSLASGGDVNDDGINDFIIGARSADPNNTNRGGETYVIFGSNQMPPLSSTATATSGLVLKGTENQARVGWSVALSGDVNGDGIDDIVVGAPGALRWTDVNDGTTGRAGQVFVIFGVDSASGGSFPAGIDLPTDLNGTNGFTVNGPSLTNSGIGSSVALGDVNNDGVDDIIIGARAEGKVYVVFGQATVTAPSSFDVTGLDGTNGYVLTGTDSTGESVASGSDVNGDGIDDIVIGAPQSSTIPTVYVFFGPGTTMPSFGSPFDLDSPGANGFIFSGDTGDQTGDSLSISGDVGGDLGGDPTNDIIIGAPGANQAYVIFGSSSSWPSSPSDLDGNNGYVLNGISTDDAAGQSVTLGGDVNVDGIDDIIIGAPKADPIPNGNNKTAGEVYIVFGSTTPPSASFDLSSLDGSNGYTLTGIVDDFTGQAVALSDINNDGKAEIIIGAPESSFRVLSGDAGKAIVVYDTPSLAPSAKPSESVAPSTLPSASAEPSTLPTMPSAEPSDMPSNEPSNEPSGQPSADPSSAPSADPTSANPSDVPSNEPSNKPSGQPSAEPSTNPSENPSFKPSAQPSSEPSMQSLQQVPARSSSSGSDSSDNLFARRSTDRNLRKRGSI